MILVGLPGTMTCDHEGCEKTQAVRFCLTATGGFAFQPHEKTWQVMLDRNGGPAFMSRCPTHKLEQPRVSVASVIPGKLIGEAH